MESYLVSLLLWFCWGKLGRKCRDCVYFDIVNLILIGGGLRFCDFLCLFFYFFEVCWSLFGCIFVFGVCGLVGVGFG